jgi:hypothetical protein
VKEDARRIREEEEGFKVNPKMVGGSCSMILSSTCIIRRTDTKQDFCPSCSLKLSSVIQEFLMLSALSLYRLRARLGSRPSRPRRTRAQSRPQTTDRARARARVALSHSRSLSLPDGALRLPSFSHFLIVNKTSLSLARFRSLSRSLSLSLS